MLLPLVRRSALIYLARTPSCTRQLGALCTCSFFCCSRYRGCASRVNQFSRDEPCRRAHGPRIEELLLANNLMLHCLLRQAVLTGIAWCTTRANVTCEFRIFSNFRPSLRTNILQVLRDFCVDLRSSSIKLAFARQRTGCNT